VAGKKGKDKKMPSTVAEHHRLQTKRVGSSRLAKEFAAGRTQRFRAEDGVVVFPMGWRIFPLRASSAGAFQVKAKDGAWG